MLLIIILFWSTSKRNLQTNMETKVKLQYKQ